MISIWKEQGEEASTFQGVLDVILRRGRGLCGMDDMPLYFGDASFDDQEGLAKLMKGIFDAGLTPWKRD